MKKFLSAMAFIFGCLAVALFIDSIKTVEWLDFQIANMQETVFCAACAIICAINIVGTIIYSFIEEVHGITPEPEPPVLFCYNCGRRKSENELNYVKIKTWNGIAEKRVCNECLKLDEVKNRLR